MLRFVTWYILRDLRAPDNRMVVVVVIASIVFVVLLCQFAAGLRDGWEAIERRRIDQGAVSRTLRAVSPDRDRPLNDAAVTSVGDELRKALGPRLRGVHPYRTVRWEFFPEPGGDAAAFSTPEFSGRTLEPGDPIAVALADEGHLILGAGRSAQSPEGLLVTRAMLTTLRFAVDARPTELAVRVRHGETGFPGATSVMGIPAVRLPITGIIEDTFDQRYQFAIAAAVQDRLAQADRSEGSQSSEILTGVVPPGWAHWRHRLDGDFPAATRRHLAAARLDLEIRTEGLGNPSPETDPTDRPRWRLINLDGQAVDRTIWTGWLEELVGAIPIAADAPDVEVFSTFTLTDQGQPLAAPEPVFEPVLYDGLFVWVADLNDLPRAAETLKASGLLYDQNLLDQLGRIDRDAGVLKFLLGSLIVAVALIAIINLAAIWMFNTRIRRHDIGLLKASGVNPVTLRLIFLAEAFALWFFAALVGTVVAMLAGRLLGPWVLGARNATEAALSFPLLSWGTGLVFVGSGVVVVLVTWWATHEARRAAPIETLASR